MAKHSEKLDPSLQKPVDSATESKETTQAKRLLVRDHLLLSHNHGQVFTYQALRFLFRAWTEEQVTKSAAERSAADGIDSGVEQVRKFLTNAGTTELKGHIYYAADRQVAHTFPTSQSEYDRATAANKLTLNQEGLDALVTELKSWATEEGSGLLEFWLSKEAIEILEQCPNSKFFWKLLHQVGWHGDFPVQAYFMKKAVQQLRNDFLLKSFNTFGKVLPLIELWLLCERQGGSTNPQTDALLKSLSVAELAFCIEEGALCLKGPGKDPKTASAHVVFNRLFLTTDSGCP